MNLQAKFAIDIPADIKKAIDLQGSRNIIEIPTAELGKMRSSLNDFIKILGCRITDEDIAEFQRLNRSVGVADLPKVGSIWPFHPQQMRRTFAMFGARHSLAGFSAIKQQFKHLIVRISEYYGHGAASARAEDVRLDHELIYLLKESRIDFEATMLYEFYNSDQPLAGKKGLQIVEERQDAPIIYKSWEMVRKLVKENKISYHTTLVNGCVNGHKCDMYGIINPAYCIECDGAIITVEHGNNWYKKHFSLVTYVSSLKNMSEGEFSHYIPQIRCAEKVMDGLGIKYVGYTCDREDP
ncbi:hypothetical protein [Geomonas ferrireducens]|uniref:hypothetical protein n=1 Tax=Geomonas ferrireducens TaxID=2570227 RepID=UPI0010A833C6|nr:hypothetical protein [Geomonas ferrireducens]